MRTDLKEIFRVRGVIEKDEELIMQIVTPEDGYSWGLSFVQLEQCPRHYHNKTTEIFVVVEGSIKLEIDGDVLALNQGDHVSLKPGQIHQVFDGEKGTRMMVYSFPPFREDDLIEVPEMSC